MHGSESLDKPADNTADNVQPQSQKTATSLTDAQKTKFGTYSISSGFDAFHLVSL